MLSDIGFPPHLVGLLVGLYDNQTAVVRWTEGLSQPISIERGVRQGCTISPALFGLYTEQIMRESNISERGISIGGRKISNLRYADDTALLNVPSHGKSAVAETQELLRDLNTAGKRKGLTINAKKTKSMLLNDTTGTIDLEGDTIEEVEDFKYLGSIKSRNGDCEKDIRARIAMTKQKTSQLMNIWRDRGIRKEVKLKLMKALLWTVVSYGCEGWTMKKVDEFRIEALEMWIYRRMLRISWRDKRTNASILQELGVERQLLGLIKRRKLSYFGHLVREGGCRLVQDAVLGWFPHPRRRGRPRMRWLDNVRTWLGHDRGGRLDLEECLRLARDRRRWRAVVWRASQTS